MVLVLTLRDVSITEGDMREICVEFAEGQIPAERIVMLSVSESSSMSLLTSQLLTATITTPHTICIKGWPLHI